MRLWPPMLSAAFEAKRCNIFLDFPLIMTVLVGPIGLKGRPLVAFHLTRCLPAVE